HERDGQASRSRLDHDPAALAVTEQPDWEAWALGREDAESGEKVVGLLLDPGLQPAPLGAADSALVERAHGDPGFEQMPPDRREEPVVVAIRRPRAGMHEHPGHRVACRNPERSRETDAARIGFEL